jgi:C4-dicarboxylate transporter DctM subunit
VTGLIAILILLALLLLGVPAWVAIGLVAAGLLLGEGMSVAGIGQLILDHLNSSTLTALPFFIVAAAFLQKGGLATALVDMAMAWLGRLRGGLAYVAVAAGAAFSTLSGSSVATAMAVGTALAPEMERRAYPRAFSLGLLGTTGTLGVLLPPSLALIIFGLLTGASIPKLFLAGVVPGIVQAILLIGTVFVARGAANLPAGPRQPLNAKLRATGRGLPALGIAVALFASIYGGLVTPTEAAAVTALLAILASLFVYKGCTYGQVLPTLAEGITNAARIVMIIGSALLLSHWIVSAGVAEGLLHTLAGAHLKPWQFLLLLNLVLLLLGIVLEGVSTLLIVTPLVAPLLKPLGIDPLHFAIIMVVNIEIGMIHPPLGMNIFVLASIGKCSTAEVIRGLWPFVGLMLFLLLLVTFVPALSTWLPNLVYAR